MARSLQQPREANASPVMVHRPPGTARGPKGMYRQHGGGEDAPGPRGRECAHTYAVRTHRAPSTRRLAARGDPPANHDIILSVLNEIHHQQNSIQINKIVHEHGIKHKSKENIECRERCV